MTTLVWFKRDLRLADHPALANACRYGAVIPLYVFEPEYWRLEDSSGRQFSFVRQSVSDLREALRVIGSDLVTRTGDVVEVFDNLHSGGAFERIASHEETGNAWTFARDRRVAAWARDRGVRWEELPQCGVKRRLGNRDGWTAQRNRFLSAPLESAPGRLTAVDIASDPVPDLCAPDPLRQAQTGGRAAGLQTLESFLNARGQRYRSAMSSPVTAVRSCSRLSPHLAFGTLSLREVVAATAARQREVNADESRRDGWKGSLKSFQSRLAWRDHFIQKLEDEPGIEHQPMHRAYAGLRPAIPDATRLAAWERGETGVPFVDACMRSLNATGWINFRMRAMLTSFATYHLWLDWRAPGLHLARMFTDYEPGIHWSQIQMQSGTTGINTPRIYNPLKQGADQDPEGVFTRTWLPELAEVPDRHLQTPWTWEGAGRLLERKYPAPLVDVATAAREARERIWAVRSAPDARAESQRVIQKHASRKDSAGHFVNDRAPRKRRKQAPETTQLSFDL